MAGRGGKRYVLAGVVAALTVALGLVGGAVAGATPRAARSALKFDQLAGVSCSSRSSCMAVGSYEGGKLHDDLPLAETFDGSVWKLAPAPRLPPPAAKGAASSATLLAVSCPASSACVAVGFGSGGALAELWNGKKWTLDRPRTPKGGQAGELTGVSCSDPGTCMAVGFYLDADDAFTDLAEQLRGTAWSLTSPPAPASARSQLNAVSCARPSSMLSCVAGGYAEDATVVVQALSWNGQRWSAVPVGADGRDLAGSLDGTSCPTSASCTLVGSDELDHHPAWDAPLAATWDDGTSTLEAAKVPKGSHASALYAVACSAAGTCAAVGSTESGAGRVTTLGEMDEHGTWSAVATPTGPAGSTGSDLAAVACPAAGVCVAVGAAQGASDDSSSSLAELWDGRAWKVKATPNS